MSRDIDPTPSAIADVTEGARTPTELIGLVRDARARAMRAEADLLVLAVAWAHSHPALPGDQAWRVAGRPRTSSEGEVLDGSATSGDLEEVEWHAIPAVAWDAPAAFAAANAMNPTAGKAYLRDALVLRHRLPRTYAGAVSCRIPVWRARRIAQVVLGAPDDVVAHLDHTLADIADQVGPTTLTRLLDEAMVRLHPEETELAQLEALEHRHATLDERSMGHTGIADMHLRGDWADLHDFDTTLSEVAAALKEAGNTESLDVRRSQAVGILADPARAQALLAGQAAPKPTRRIIAYVHLSQAAIEGSDLLAHDHTGRTLLTQTVREWCARDDRFLDVRPVIDLTTQCDGSIHTRLGGHTDPVAEPDAYRPDAQTRERVQLRDQTCVAPHCTRPAIACDLDHLIAHAKAGTTCECDLAPLCRHHHLLKTHAGWRYQALAPGTYLWTEPHGQHFLTTPTGTRDLTT